MHALLRRPDSLLHVEHACYLVAGRLVWWPAFQGTMDSGAKAARGLQ